MGGKRQPRVANPWLIGAAPTAVLPREDLEERILNLLSTQNMGVVATVGPDGPLATPVRLFNRDFTLIFTSQAGTPKMQNIAADPRVSIGVFAPLYGEASSRGAQVFGTARVLTTDDAEFHELLHVYRWQSDTVERGRSLDDAPRGPLVAVDAQRIVYTEHWLRRRGFGPRQFWRARND